MDRAGGLPANSPATDTRPVSHRDEPDAARRAAVPHWSLVTICQRTWPDVSSHGGVMIPTHTDVLIVGAGPTGLLLAGDLAAAGVRCTVLERRTEESNLTRAFGVHARTLEQLDARGLASDVIATGGPVGSVWLFGN